MSGISIGSIKIDNLLVGTFTVQAAYVGSNSVWPACDLPPYGCNTNVNPVCVTNLAGAWSTCSFSSFPSLNVGSGTNFEQTWAFCSSLTSFPTLNVSSGVNFKQTWEFCSGLTSFPVLNVSSGVDFSECWRDCTGLTSFSQLDFSSAENLNGTWANCSSLTSFPSILNTDSALYVNGTWSNCSSLTSFPGDIDVGSAVTLNYTWYNCSSLTSFPSLTLGLTTSFWNTWAGCSSLTSFPVVYTGFAQQFSGAWYGCTSLTSFPALDFDSGLFFGEPYVNFPGSWENCTSLVTFPANLFDNCPAVMFYHAWRNCALSQQSVDNILVSLDIAGQINGIVHIDSGTSSPPGVAGLAAKASLESRGWTVVVNSAAPLTLTISSDSYFLTGVQTSTVTFSFSNEPTGFGSGDITVSGGSLTGLSVSLDPKVYTATFTPTPGTNNGSASISVGSGSYGDIYGNSGVSASCPTINYDTSSPYVSSISLTSSTGGQNNTLNLGDTITATVTFDEIVVVTGSPLLALDIGGTPRNASYVSGSGSTNLAFSYTIQSGDTDANGISINANSLSLNAGTIQDTFSNNANLYHSAVSGNSSYLVDTTNPNAPIIALGTGVSGGADFSEATQSGGVVMVTAELGSSVSVTFTGTGGSVIKNVTGNGGSPVPVVLTPANVNTLGQGSVSVSALATDAAGNSSSAGTASFTLSYSGDPYLANLSLLLHANSDTGSKTITDNSGNNFAVSTAGISYVSTAQSKFEGSSIFLGYIFPVGSSLTVPHNNAFEFGTGDFTLEFYIYITQMEVESFTIYTKGGGIDINGDNYGGGRLFTLIRNDANSIVFGSTTGQEIVTGLGSQLNAWHHYALSRSGNNFYIFWDGVLKQTFNSSVSIKANTSDITIDGPRVCYIDEFRITKGVGRYTAAFTVPNAQFQGVSYPLILTDRHYFPANQPSTVAFRFPEPPTGFDINSISASGGTISNLVSVSSKLYSATFTPTSGVTNDTASITVGAGSYYDTFGAANISNSSSFTINSSKSEPKATTVLLHMDGSNNSTTFTDSGAYGLSFVPVQNAKLSTTQSKFGGTSGAFLTNGDYVYTSDNNSVTFRNGDFTIEAWIYPLNPTSNVFSVERAICGLWSATNASAQAWLLCLDSGYLKFVVNYPDDTTIFSIPGMISEEKWYHVAVSRSGTSMYCFINGFLQATYNAGTTSINSFPNTFGVGGYNRGSGTATFYGYIDDLRITKGVCRYTKDFYLPQQAFTNPGPLTEFEQYVSLLLHMDGGNGSTTFTDSSSNALAVSKVGSAQISTAQSKFGGSSGSFDGNGDYLTVPTDPVFNFGTGDFTVEAWVYITSTPSDFLIISASGSGGFFFGALITTGGGWGVGRAAIAWDFTTGVSPVLNTWQHIAVSRSGTSLRIFVDGTQAGTTNSNSRSYDLSTTSLTIGSQGAGYYLTGNIDELRVTRGLARYTSNFTPPSAPFPDT